MAKTNKITFDTIMAEIDGSVQKLQVSRMGNCLTTLAIRLRDKDVNGAIEEANALAEFAQGFIKRIEQDGHGEFGKDPFRGEKFAKDNEFPEDTRTPEQITADDRAEQIEEQRIAALRDQANDLTGYYDRGIYDEGWDIAHPPTGS